MPRIGWPGAFVLSQTLLMAALFLPGVSSARTVLRIGSYAMGLVFWGLLLWRGRAEPAGPRFPARAWLGGSMVCLGLELLHPNNHSFLTAVAQVVLYVAIMSPAFWAARSLADGRQLSRLIALMFACNAVSVLLGIGQVYQPDRFNPPVIPALSNQFAGENLMYETDDGRKVLRPCGLSDTPGAAASAGTVVALFGLSWALLPVAWWKRLSALALAFFGVVVIYYSHIRSTLVMLAVSLIALAILLALRRHYRQVTLLLAGSGLLIFGGLAWAVRTIGGRIFERFAVLVTHGPLQASYESRGGFVEEGLTALMSYPLGVGLGWWGMIYGTFGDHSRMSNIWVEVMIQAWVYDGGLPLLIGYGGAVIVAMITTLWIALTSRDTDVSYWAAVIFASNLSVVASCLSFLTFLSPIGMTFWLLSALVYAADQRSRAAAATATATAASSARRRVPPPPGPSPRPRPA